jgi:c-di-GMP-binding flagellar brake protein YcgR
MLLPANPPVGILTHGKVVKMQETGNGEYDVGLSFVDIDEEVRDAIIQYTLKRQREIIRKQRQQRGTNV